MPESTLHLKNISEAVSLLETLHAPARLLKHIALVGEAADLLIAQLTAMSVPLDPLFIRLGVVFHDIGKIDYPQELIEKGNCHEAAGEILLLQHGVPPPLARCARSHAQWQSLPCSVEELVVALADTLWKGVRKSELELKAIDQIAERLHCARWDIFIPLDACFEKIASTGDERLQRSQQ